MTTLRDVLQLTHTNLQILQQREAGYGGSAPLDLLNQIDDHRQAIALLQVAVAVPPLTVAALVELKTRLRPLLIAANVEAIELESLQPDTPPLPFEPETVLIPAGPFWLGCDDRAPEEAPRHQVDLPAFRLGRFPVTNAQYAEFLARELGQSVPRKSGWFTRQPPRHKLDHPVVGVSWHDAVAYCNWLSRATGRTYRLPSEAEWEKAAAWDGQQTQCWPWGNQFEPERCNSAEAGLDDTTSVQRYSPAGDSHFGCADMLGNVQEWTSTLWGADLQTGQYPYPYRRDDGREAPDAPLPRMFRLHRGGSYRDPAGQLRCSVRGWSDPDSKIRWRGFRVALEV